MKFATLSLTALILTSAGLCAGSANAQTQTQTQTPATAGSRTFTFHVCNKTSHDASVAIAAHVSVDDDKNWYTQGWWVVSAGDCSVIGEFPKGWFYYYAKSKTGDWRGSGNDASNTCVRDAPYKRPDPPGYQCGNNEKLVAFNGKHIDEGDSFTWNLE